MFATYTSPPPSTTLTKVPIYPAIQDAMPLTVPSVFPPASDEVMKFPSRRSVVHNTKGIVACTQPLAAKCGLEVLQAGGNCAVSRSHT